MSVRIYNNKSLRILISLILIFTMILGSYEKGRADGFALSIAGASMIGAGGVGATALAFAPYIVLALAVVGTGALVYETQDEIIAVAQWLYENMKQGGEWFGSQVRTGYFNLQRLWNDTKKELIMTKELKTTLVDAVGVIPETLPLKTSVTGEFTLPALNTLIENIPINTLPKYVAIKFPNSENILYIQGFPMDVAFQELVPLSTNSLTVLRVIGNHDRDNVNVNLYSASFSQMLFERLSPDTPHNSIASPILLADLSSYYPISSFEWYRMDSLKLYLDRPTFASRIVYLSGFDFPDTVARDNFINSMTVEYRDFWEESTSIPVSTSVPITTTADFPTTAEREAELNTYFPTNNGVIAVDVTTDIPLTGIEGVFTDTGVIAPDIPNVDIDAGTVTNSITSALEGTLVPEFLPQTYLSFMALENVRVDPPKIMINLNKIFNASTSIISPDTPNPFPDEETSFIDFNDLNRYNYEGVQIIDFVRNIIGFGMIYSTMLYIWRKLQSVGGDE